MTEPSEPASHRRDLLPELAQVFVVVTWASTFVLTKHIFEVASPLAYAFVRFVSIIVIAGIVLAVLAQRPGSTWRIARADVPRFIVAGMLGYTLYQLAFVFGLNNTSPFSSSLLVAMVPLFTLAIVTAMGERAPFVVWTGAFVAVAGVALFLSDQEGGGTLVGNGLSLAAAVIFALYGVVSRPLVRKYPASVFAAWSTSIGAIPLLAMALPSALSQEWRALAPWHWLAIVYLGVAGIYVAYILWNWSIRQRGVQATSWILLVPVTAGVMSSVFYGEDFGFAKIAGGAIALLGLTLMRPRAAS